MMSFIVIRESRSLMVWYVNAVDAASAIERVFPTDAASQESLREEGGLEAPALEALVSPERVWARPILRCPEGFHLLEGAHAR